MLGKSESQIFNEIERGCFGIGRLSINIPRQKALNPDDILAKLATGVSKAIAANNSAIEQQLRNVGIKL